MDLAPLRFNFTNQLAILPRSDVARSMSLGACREIDKLLELTLTWPGQAAKSTFETGSEQR